jgi:hypothetical protein
MLWHRGIALINELGNVGGFVGPVFGGWIKDLMGAFWGWPLWPCGLRDHVGHDRPTAWARHSPRACARALLAARRACSANLSSRSCNVAERLSLGPFRSARLDPHMPHRASLRDSRSETAKAHLAGGTKAAGDRRIKIPLKIAAWLVLKCRLARPQHLADRVPGHLQIPDKSP